MTRPYSADLRERIVRSVEGGTSRNKTAALFDVSVSFVVKLMQRWSQRGTIEPDQYGGWKQPSLTPHAGLLRDILAEQNDLTLGELRLRLAAHGIETSVPTLCRFLKSEGLTRKKRRSMPASKNGRTSPRRAPPGSNVSR